MEFQVHYKHDLERDIDATLFGMLSAALMQPQVDVSLCRGIVIGLLALATHYTDSEFLFERVCAQLALVVPDKVHLIERTVR